MVRVQDRAHINLRLPLRALGRGVVVGLAVATLAGAGSNSIVDELIGSTGLLTALSFTRDQERAADELAVTALVSRYGHAEGSTQLFEILSREHDDSNEPSNSLPRTKVPEFFSTHPLSQNRILAIGAQARKNNWQVKGNAQEIPKSILEEIKRLHEDLRNKSSKEKAKAI